MQTGVADPNPYDGVEAGKLDLWTYDHYHGSTYGYYLEALVIFGSADGPRPALARRHRVLRVRARALARAGGRAAAGGVRRASESGLRETGSARDRESRRFGALRGPALMVSVHAAISSGLACATSNVCKVSSGEDPDTCDRRGVPCNVI